MGHQKQLSWTHCLQRLGGCQGNRAVSLAEEMKFAEQLVQCLKSCRDFVNVNVVPCGSQGILDHPGRKPFIEILILVCKAIVAMMYLNLIIVRANQHFDSLLNNSVHLGKVLKLSDHNLQ